MEEEINLRPYIELLLKRWYWILVAAALSASAAYLISSNLPETYVAQSGIAIARSRTEVTFDSQIRTLSDDEIGAINDFVELRRDALVALVKTSDVATRVVTDVGSSLHEEDRVIANLLDTVEASSTGDLIFITVSHSEPETAALIANSWGKNYENYINELYGNEPRINLDLLSNQVSESRIDYEEAQATLESFIQTNDAHRLNQEIVSRQGILSIYLTARDNIQSGAASLQVDSDMRYQAALYLDLQRIEQLMADATSLRSQIAAVSSSTGADLGNLFSYISLSNRIYREPNVVEPHEGLFSDLPNYSDLNDQTLPLNLYSFYGETNTPASLQFDIGAEIPAGFVIQASDVDTLIEVLDSRKEWTLTQIASVQESFLTRELEEVRLDPNHAFNTRINVLDSELQALTADLEATEAINRELVQARDLAWNTYQALLLKQAEAEIATQTSGTEVRFAASAIQPDRPSSSGRLVNTILAGLLAAGATTVGLIAHKWWEQGDPVVASTT